ncbi:MAG: AraC family transcriptional regulator [Finegoldia sp.]|nr:AraC family transcriptional regulator [Finegoldia sp.]
MDFLKIETYDCLNNKDKLTHWHDVIEIIKISSDGLICVINGQYINLNCGDICVINKNQIHRLEKKDEDISFKRISINFKKMNMDRDLYDKYIIPMTSDESFDSIVINNKCGLNNYMTSIIDDIIEEDKFKNLGYELQITGLIYIYLRKLYQVYVDQRQYKSSDLNSDIYIQRRMSSFIYDNYYKKISLNDIAKAGNISKSKCINIFKYYTQHTPIDFLNLYRLNVSTQLLKNTSKNIGEISSSVGFDQQSYYNKLFLREYNLTPSAYRKNYLSKLNKNIE